MKLKNKNKFRVPIVVEQDEDNVFIVSCPTFSACRSYGRTIDDAMENINQVISMCMKEISVKEFNSFIGFREIEITSS